MARQNNIPVIFFNREPVWEDLMQWEDLYYVGCDAEQSGVMQGEIAADYIKKNRKDRLLLFSTHSIEEMSLMEHDFEIKIVRNA